MAEKLKGLKGLRDLSTEERRQWRKDMLGQGKITEMTSPEQLNIMYENQQYIAKYGIDDFESKTYAERKRRWDYDIIQPAFEKRFSPVEKTDDGVTFVNPKKGLGYEYFDYNSMSLDNKKALLESDYLLPDELKEKIEKDKEGHFLYKLADWGSTILHPMLGVDDKYNTMKNIEMTIPNAVEATITRSKVSDNKDIIESIHNRDLEEKKRLADPYSRKMYDDLSKLDLDDDTIKEAFIKDITPIEGQYQGNPVFAAYYGNGTEVDSTMKDYDTDKMREYLSKKAAYTEIYGESVANNILTNEARKYISDKQSNWRYWEALGKDIGFSTASYTADKLNSVRQWYLGAVDAVSDDVEVYMDDKRNVYPIDSSSVVNSGNNTYIKNEDGSTTKVWKTKLSRTSLDQMGYDTDGNKRGNFWNPDYWSKVEQFGTTDENLLAQYSKLGVSPYKWMYEKGDETDIFYETAKMTSFILGDVGAEAAIALTTKGIGRGASAAAKGLGASTKVAGAIETGITAIGKAHPLLSATGIGSAYGRGVFAETIEGNITKLEESINNKAYENVKGRYDSNPQFKKRFNDEVQVEYAKLLDNGVYSGYSSEQLLSIAKSAVADKYVKDEVDILKESDDYRNIMAELIDEASTAALAASITTGIKYAFVNYAGHRKFLFNTGSETGENVFRRIIDNVKFTAKGIAEEGVTGATAKSLGKVAARQFWGGAWTNYTDELQSGGARQLNEDAVSAYLNGMYDSEGSLSYMKAVESGIGFLDAVDSYRRGATDAALAQNSLKAGLVGGLGSTLTVAPNIAAMATTFATKSGREAYKNMSTAEKINTFIQNGILSEYVAGIAGEKMAKEYIKLYNDLVEANESFDILKNLVALDRAEMDATSADDKNLLSFLKALTIMSSVKDFQNSEKSSEALRLLMKKSPVAQKALQDIEKLSKGTYTEEEAAEYLKEFYAENPGITQSEENNSKALQTLEDNAKALLKAEEFRVDAEKKLDKYEKEHKVKLPQSVRSSLVLKAAVRDELQQQIARNERVISGVEAINESKGIDFRTYGTQEAIDRYVAQFDTDIEKANQYIEDTKDTIKESEEIYDQTKKDGKEEEILTAKAVLENAKIQLKHLEGVREKIKAEKEELENADTTSTEGESILTADEIIMLDPISRARMLNPNNIANYSIEQQEQIIKAEEQLKSKDPNALKLVQSQATAVLNLRSNDSSYNMMLDNPEAAAIQWDINQRNAAIQAGRFYNSSKAKFVESNLDKILADSTKNGEEISKEATEYLKSIETDVLSLMEKNSTYSDMVHKAIKYRKEILPSIVSVIKDLGMSSQNTNQLVKDIQAAIVGMTSKEEILDTLGNMANAQTDEASKGVYVKVIDELEKLLEHQSSTIKLTPEEKSELLKKTNELLTQERKRREREREEAKKNAEERAKEIEDKNGTTEQQQPRQENRGTTVGEAVHGITEEDRKGDTKGEEAATYRLTDKDNTSETKGLTEEEILDAIENGDYVPLKNVETVHTPTTDYVARGEDNVVTTEIASDPPNGVDDTNSNKLVTNESAPFTGNWYQKYNTIELQKRVLVERSGAQPNDTLNTYIKWQQDNGMDIQSIIDFELSDIAELNQPIYTMVTKPSEPKTITETVFLVVEYTDKVEAIHNKDFGGVIDFNGKKYLIIGTLSSNSKKYPQGFETRNFIYNKLRSDSWSSGIYEGQVNKDGISGTEKYYVSTDYKLTIREISGGIFVRSIEGEDVKLRSIGDLIKDPKRNPRGLKFEDLKFGINERSGFKTVGIEEGKVVLPKASDTNIGSAFLLLKDCRGMYIPIKIKAMTLADLREGRLTETIDKLIGNLLKVDHATRLEAVKGLAQLLYLDPALDEILIGTETNSENITIVKNGIEVQFKIKDTDASVLRDYIYNTLNPRIHIGTDTVKTAALMQIYSDAGALDVDIASLAIYNADFSLYDIDENGNTIIPEGETPLATRPRTTASMTDKDSALVGNKIYRKKDGTWKNEVDKDVTDPILLEQIDIAYKIKSEYIPVDMVSEAGIKVYILNPDRDNPLVVSKGKNNMYTIFDKERALKAIDYITNQKKEKEREEGEAKAIKEAEERANSGEADSIVGEGAEIVVFPDEEQGEVKSEDEKPMTDDEIVEQFTGEKPEKKPIIEGKSDNTLTEGQKRAKEKVSTMQNESSNFELTSDEKFYIDRRTGEKYLRVTSVISAVVGGERFDPNNPWILPSTSIGNGVDRFIRDYFNNNLGDLSTLNERYPNCTNEALIALKKQLDYIKNRFDQGGITIVSSGIMAYGEVMIDATHKVKVAGTLDLLAYDKDGNFFIIDVKTNHTIPDPNSSFGAKKIAKWSRQVSLYKSLLENKFGVKVDRLGILQLGVSYPDPTRGAKYTTQDSSKKDQLYKNGEKFTEANPTIFEANPLLTVNEVGVEVKYDLLLPEEKAIVETIKESNPKQDKSSKAEVIKDEIKPIEDVNQTGNRSYADLQSKKTPTDLNSILSSEEYGLDVVDKLSEKFGEEIKAKYGIEIDELRIDTLADFLASKDIPVTNISNVDEWINGFINNCR